MYELIADDPIIKSVDQDAGSRRDFRW